MNKKIVEEIVTKFALDVLDKFDSHLIMESYKNKEIDLNSTIKNLEEGLQCLELLGRDMEGHCKPVDLMDDLKDMNALVDQLGFSDERLRNRIKVLNDFN